MKRFFALLALSLAVNSHYAHADHLSATHSISPPVVASGAIGAAIGYGVSSSAWPAGAALGALVGLQSEMALRNLLLPTRAINHFIVRDRAFKMVLAADQVFAFNSDQLRPDRLANLTTLSQVLKRHAGHQKILIRVYHDNIGSNEDLKNLTTQRAQQLRAFLWHQGMEAQLIAVTGMGSHDPISSNRYAQGNRLNRRVEICTHPCL